MSSIDSLKNSALGDATSKYYEKTVTDMNNVDESFANARDLGHTRLNYSRLTAIGKLANFDKVDIYKTTVISNRGKLSISLMSASDDEKVLDLSKYESYLDELKKEFDPEGYAKEQEAKKAEEAKKKSLEYTAPGLRLEVYGTDRLGRQVLIGDSAADEDSDEYKAITQILSGEYEASKGAYYLKVSRTEDNTSTDEVPYALQIKLGDAFKYDYVAMEQESDDTKNKTESKIPLTADSSGNLSSVNALQIQATRYQATAQMLQVGYQNMAAIYNKNSKF